MGFFSNLIGKAKGVFGRVVGGIKKALPVVAGVLGKVGDFTGIPLVKTIANVANTANSLINKAESGDYQGAIDDAKAGFGQVRDTIEEVKKIMPKRGKLKVK